MGGYLNGTSSVPEKCLFLVFPALRAALDAVSVPKRSAAHRGGVSFGAPFSFRYNKKARTCQPMGRVLYCVFKWKKGGLSMRRDARTFGTLFLSTFKLSAFTFGGGYVIIPLMRKQFVDRLGWLEEQEMLDLTAIAQSSPGPIAVNAAILLGYRVAGVPGAMVTMLGTVIPPLVVLSVISLFYDAFRSNLIVSRVMKGMQAGVAAVIFDVVLTMAGQIIGRKRAIPIVTLAGAFIASWFFDVHILLILLACALIGLAQWRSDTKKGAAA